VAGVAKKGGSGVTVPVGGGVNSDSLFGLVFSAAAAVGDYRRIILPFVVLMMHSFD